MEDKNSIPPPFENVGGTYLDHRNKRFIIVTKDIFINQLRRDCSKISISFDKLVEADLAEVSEMGALVLKLVIPHIVEFNLANKTREATCARLLQTAMTTFIGCIHLARGGFRLQYMSLSRSVVETICTIMHLMVEPSAICDFHADKLESTKSIAVSKKVLPGLNKLWGELSNQFVHINTMHSGFNALKTYSDGDEDLDVIRVNMKTLSWLLLVTAELVFIDNIQHPRYWRIVNRRAEGSEVSFDPSLEERKWLANFLKMEMI